MSETTFAEAAFGVEQPPTQEELPYDDGVPMESHRHKLQMDLLTDPLWLWWADRQNFFVGGNMFVYFSLEQARNQDFRGPDVFVVLDVPRGERKSWVVWEEGKGPDVVIELLSESTAERDKTEKKQIYQNRLRVPEYFWFDPFNPKDLAGFSLRDGLYEPIALNSQAQLISQQLQFALVCWQGEYKDVEAVWLRWATPEGDLLPTSQESAEQEHQRAEQAEVQLEQQRQRAEQEQQRADQEYQRAEQAEVQLEHQRQRAEQLVARLRAMGVDLEEH